LILFINKSAADIFNVSTQDIINKHILTLDRSITLQKAIETAMGGHLFEDIFAIGENSFNLLASPVKDEVVVKGVILFILDVTEKQSAEKCAVSLPLMCRMNLNASHLHFRLRRAYEKRHGKT